MKISIIGGGAMGSIYAALMARTDNTIVLIDNWKEHIAAIKRNGLKVSGASGNRTIKSIKASTNINDAKGSNLYIIATKTFHVEQVATQLKPLIRNKDKIISIQNGLGSGDLLAKYIEPKNIFLGVAEGFGASVVKPGCVHHNSMKLIRIGELMETDFSRVIDLAKVWENSGFETKAYSDISVLVWEKFLCNVTFSGPCTVLGITLGKLMSTPEYWKIALGCMDEAYRVGLKKSISFSFNDPEKYVSEFGLRMPNAKPSMLLDHENKKPSEIGAINGKVVELAKNEGLITPYNETITAIITHKEQTTRKA